MFIVISAALLSPVAFLAVGFYGVSKKRAEEGRAHLKKAQPSPYVSSSEPINEPAQTQQISQHRPAN